MDLEPSRGLAKQRGPGAMASPYILGQEVAAAASGKQPHMSTFTLRRFSSAEALKAIRPGNLIALLERSAEYFRRRGVSLDLVDGTEAPDYDGIVKVLMTPDEHAPPSLVDDLFFVHEMSTAEAMDELLEEVGRLPPATRDEMDFGPTPTPADVAVLVRLKVPDLLERKHAEHRIAAKRSFDYFQGKDGVDRTFHDPEPETISRLEKTLDDRLDDLKRGRNSRVAFRVNGRSGSGWAGGGAIGLAGTKRGSASIHTPRPPNRPPAMNARPMAPLMHLRAILCASGATASPAAAHTARGPHTALSDSLDSRESRSPGLTARL